MLTVKELIKHLNFLIDNKYLSENDVAVLIGTGDKETCFLSSVAYPQVTLKNPIELLDKPKGYFHLGFTTKESIYQGSKILWNWK